RLLNRSTKSLVNTLLLRRSWSISARVSSPPFGSLPKWQSAHALRTPALFSKAGLASKNVWEDTSHWCGPFAVGPERHPILGMWQSTHVTPFCSISLPAYISLFGAPASPSAV